VTGFNLFWTKRIQTSIRSSKYFSRPICPCFEMFLEYTCDLSHAVRVADRLAGMGMATAPVIHPPGATRRSGCFLPVADWGPAGREKTAHDASTCSGCTMRGDRAGRTTRCMLRSRVWGRTCAAPSDTSPRRPWPLPNRSTRSRPTVAANRTLSYPPPCWMTPS